METQVRTPQMIFMQPQRLVVPLFQRPYVWNEENQWEPLWKDVERVAQRVLERPAERHHPHFLGAVVLQQVQRQTGHMQERTIIDGQQRLTTLQLLLDALHAQVLAVDAQAPAMRIEPLVTNAEPFCSKEEDRFKVWPTNRDRPAFNAVMGATPPVDYDRVGYPSERMVQAHRFFSEQAREWLNEKGPESAGVRAATIETVVRELLQLVVIDLATDENAQEIFETLNARGAQLSAADLIKNFIFQRLLEAGTNVEAAYEQHWKDFETGFWEKEISVGRLLYPRSAIFLNHWLIARTGEEIVAREVFERFKRFANETGLPMSTILVQVHEASRAYREFITDASTLDGAITRLGLFAYRTGVMESEVIKPLVLCLLDPVRVPDVQLTKALAVIESWMVRRMLVRATTKSYSQVVAELVKQVDTNREHAGDTIEAYLAQQTAVGQYWPDDAEVTRELESLLAYRRLSRGRLRMVLEAIEDHRRGWRDGQSSIGAERISRGKLHIEHIMPRKWITHWPLQVPEHGEAERDRLIHTVGNLTLLMKQLNSKVSNGPWLGSGGKREGLEQHDVLLLNRDVLKRGGDEWTEASIRQRSGEMIDLILEIWPVPPNHRVFVPSDAPRVRKKFDLADLINAGAVQPGINLYPRRAKYSERVATVLPDGRIEIDDQVFSGPSEAAAYIRGKPTNGWWFFYADRASHTSLRSVRSAYVGSLAGAIDVDEADDDDEGDDDEE